MTSLTLLTLIPIIAKLFIIEVVYIEGIRLFVQNRTKKRNAELLEIVKNSTISSLIFK